MPYDEELAHRIRQLMAGTPGLTERKMFGGIGWMVNGNMACGAHSDGSLMIRCSRENHEAYSTDGGARAMERGGKGMAGWILVSPETVASHDGLVRWVDRGRAHAVGMPAKKK